MALFDLERVTARNRAEWRQWLAEHYRQGESIWLVTYKGGELKYNDIVEEALCFGWIDSRPAKLDEKRTMLLLSPRKPQSRWSKLNKERVARLEAAGLMQEAGAAKVREAKRSGAWDALNDVDALIVPPDLTEAIARVKNASAYFAAFPPSARRGILEWILAAKSTETRARRIAETARLAGRNVRANTPAAKKSASA